MEEGELLAAYRASDGYGNLVEDAAADRDIKPWQDLENFTGQDVKRMEMNVLYPMGVMEGSVRPLMEAQRVAALLRRAEAEVFMDSAQLPGYPVADIAMKKVALLARNLRGQT